VSIAHLSTEQAPSKFRASDGKFSAQRTGSEEIYFEWRWQLTLAFWLQFSNQLSWSLTRWNIWKYWSNTNDAGHILLFEKMEQGSQHIGINLGQNNLIWADGTYIYTITGITTKEEIIKIADSKLQ